jgi:hypothetical protein
MINTRLDYYENIKHWGNIEKKKIEKTIMVVTTKIKMTSKVSLIYNKNPTRSINLALSHQICHKLLFNIHYPQI